MTAQETITNVFNDTVPGCKRRRDAKPRLDYLPGCSFIECEHADCRCRMNDGDGGPISAFIARWQTAHGVARN
jgi:hypothetical protein